MTMKEQIMQQPITSLTLRIPAALVEQVRRRAGATHRSLNRYIVEAVARQVSQPEIPGETHAERIKSLLEGEGLLAKPPRLELEREAAESPLLSYEDLWRELKGQRPLSKDIIEMRGEL